MNWRHTIGRAKSGPQLDDVVARAIEQAAHDARADSTHIDPDARATVALTEWREGRTGPWSAGA